MHTFRRTTHRTWKFGVLGVTAAALLATAACGPTDSKAGDAPSSKLSASSSVSTQPGGSGNAGDPGSDEGTCTDANTDVTAEFALPPQTDDSKLLLTVTNTGDEPCSLYGYPAVKFGEAQSVPPVINSSKPQAVVVLDPGKEGYAGVLANQSNKEVATNEKILTVGLQSKSGGIDTGEGTAVKLPTQGVYVDDKIHVTYWQSTSERAVSPLFLH